LNFIAFQEISLTKQEEIIREIRDLKDLFRNVMKTQSSEDQVFARDHKYPTLPLRTEIELREAEVAIREESQFLKLVSIV